MTNQSIGEIVFDDIGLALQIGEDPALQAAIAGISPFAAALMKFLPVIIPAVKGVGTVAFGGQGAPTVQPDATVPPTAVTAVANHLTPGAPDAPALSAGAKTS